MCEIPSSVKILLPAEGLSVLSFLHIPLPNESQPHASFSHAGNFTSELYPNVEGSDIGSPLAILRPPLTVLRTLIHQIASPSVNSIVCPHIPVSQGKHYPLWLVRVWDKTTFVRNTQQKWQDGTTRLIAALSHPQTNKSLYQQVLNALAHVPWTGRLLGFRNIDVHQLVSFFNNDWLSDDHVLLMSDLLQETISPRLQGRVYVEESFFMTMLMGAYEDQAGYRDATSLEWIRTRGCQLAAGQKSHLATVVNIDNVHWVALVLDFETHHILYGDSGQGRMPADIKNTLDWWTYHHTNITFTHSPLPITTQQDSFSCGIFAWDALRHELSNRTIPLIPASGAAEARLKIFLELTKQHHHLSLDDHADPPHDDPPPPPSNNPESRPPKYDDDASSADDSTSSDDDEEPELALDAAPIQPVKRPKLEVASSVRTAIESESHNGLLFYFKKATEAEHRESMARATADIHNRMVNEEWSDERERQRQKSLKRRRARERKRDQRRRERQLDIDEGRRHPDGTKIKITIPILAEPTTLDQGGSVAELSRPKRAIVAEFKAKIRKPQGRKAKKLQSDAIYHNWFTPFLFQQIEQARIHAGGPQWSTRAIVRELKKRDGSTFRGLSRTTINGWIDRSGSKPKWSDRTLERVRRGNMVGHSAGGQKGLLAEYPEVVKEVVGTLQAIRSCGSQVTSVTARGVMVATILGRAPELLQQEFRDGSTFRATESFMRKFLRDAMHWSRRQGTQAAQKKPIDWEDQCYRAALRRAYIIKEEDIPSALVVNSDQTQVVYAPGDKMTWAETGAKQVPVLGAEEKRAFTAFVSVASDGSVLPIQAIYTGKTKRSCPSSNAPHYSDLIELGFILQESGTSTYWSNLETMKRFVDQLLSPWLDNKKIELHLPLSQKSLWMIDVWVVHRSVDFRTWMGETHPTIIVDYIPGGCTDVGQPCDVGIQRPFKLSIKRSYQEDIVSDILKQLKNRTSPDDPVAIDTRLPTLRDSSTRWLWNAYRAINRQDLVKKAFSLCVVRDLDLSYDCLAGAKIRAKLRELRHIDPDFWAELTQVALPPEDVVQPEDIEQEEVHIDDVDVPIDAVVSQVVYGEVQEGYTVSEGGILEATAAAEAFEDDGEEDESVASATLIPASAELGRGKRKRRANTLYNRAAFWRHDDNDNDDSDMF